MKPSIKFKIFYDMSQNEAEEAVVWVKNKMFGPNWKLHSDNKLVIDLDTSPDCSATRTAGKSMEALTINEIVKKLWAHNISKW